MKFFASHSKILDEAGNPDKQAEHSEHLDEIGRRVEALGGKVVDKSRYNIAIEMAEHRLHQLFDFALDTAEGFFGAVENVAGDLKDWVDHLEIEHDARWHSGS